MQRYPNIDAMLFHLGGTRIAGVRMTLDAEQGADVVELIQPAMTVPRVVITTDPNIVASRFRLLGALGKGTWARSTAPRT